MTRVDRHAPNHRAEASGTSKLILNALKLSELFATWPEAQLEALQQHSHWVKHQPRELIMPHNTNEQTLLCVINGHVEVSSINPSGDRYVHNLMGAGAVLPIVLLLEAHTPTTYDYYASTRTELIRVSIPAVQAALQAEPQLWKSVAELALKRQQSSLRLLHKQVLSSTKQRLASMLSQLAQNHTRSGAPTHAQPFLVEVNQTNLAAMLGATRQTVNKELRLLAEAGVLELQYSRILILDLPQLQHIAA